MNDIYTEAAEKMAATHQQRAETSAAVGLAAAFSPGYTEHPRSMEATPLQVIEFLTIQLGASIAERNALRSRVWQLEQVNTTHLIRRQEACDEIGALRGRISELEHLLKQAAPEKQFVVIGCFGANARTERPMEMLSCASANGQTRIRVDARVKRRKRVSNAG